MQCNTKTSGGYFVLIFLFSVWVYGSAVRKSICPHSRQTASCTQLSHKPSPDLLLAGMNYIVPNTQSKRKTGQWVPAHGAMPAVPFPVPRRCPCLRLLKDAQRLARLTPACWGTGPLFSACFHSCSSTAQRFPGPEIILLLKFSHSPLWSLLKVELSLPPFSGKR